MATTFRHDVAVSHRSRLLALAAGALAALVPAAAQAAVPQVLKPDFHAHAIEGTPATVTIRLPHVTRSPVTVAWATAPMTALAGLDYVSASGQVTIPRGSRSASLQVRTVRDHVDELTEEFRVDFSRPSGAPLGPRRSTIVRIVDRNPIIATIRPLRVTEPTRPGDTVPIGALVKLRGASACRMPVAVGYEVTGVEPTVDGNDATLGSGTLHFRRGQVSKVIPGVIKGDGIDEGPEHLLITLSGSRGVYARLGAEVTIVDSPHDTAPAISIGDISAPENSSGAVEVPLTLSAPSQRPVTVTYATAPGTATVDDFVMKVGTVVFPPNTTTVDASVVLNDDQIDEPNQDFTISLSNPLDATIDDGTATFTIVDDDPPPIITVQGTNVSEDAGTATVKLKLSQPTENTVSVLPTVASHSAHFGDHCAAVDSDPNPVDALTPSADPVTFAPGATTATMVVTICEDYATEPDELIDFSFGSPVNAILGDTTAEVRIVDNDPLPQITVDAECCVATEGDATGTVTLMLDHPTGNTVTVHRTIAGHTATFGAACSMNISDPDPPDVITPAAEDTVTFPPFATVAHITLDLCNDANMEPTETVDFHFDTPVNATLGTTTATLSIFDDDM